MTGDEQKAWNTLCANLPAALAPRRTGSALEVRTPSGTEAVRVRWAGGGTVPEVERALDSEGIGRLVVVADVFSASSRMLLDALGIGWASVEGEAELRFGDQSISRRNTTTAAVTRAGRSRPLSWNSSAMAVGEALLSMASRRELDGDRIPTTHRLADLLGRSVGAISMALQGFDDEQWTTPSGARRGRSAFRSLTDPAGLLESWAPQVARQRSAAEFYHSVVRDRRAIVDMLVAAFGAEIAFSGRLAAETVAPLSTAPGAVRCYLADTIADSRRREALADAGLQPAGTDGVLAVGPDRPGILALARPQAGLRIVSPPRIYADLLSDGARGPDSANHYRRTVIGF